ncbi:MAG TPA: hypothetical protein VNU97_04660 [Rhizomicrobium sp.]|nr:hypothetical protein [Rhizomicrobium sp.]
MKTAGIAFAILTLAACAQTPVLSPSQLNANPQLYDEQIVKIRGYAILAPEGHSLDESEADFKAFARHYDVGVPVDPSFHPQDHFKFCLTIANPDFLLDHIKEFAFKTIVVKGKFLAHYLGPNDLDIGACPLPTAIAIDIDDLKRRYGIRN